MDSDDSSFYGDEDTVARLNNIVRYFDVDAWIEQHRAHPDRPRRHKSSAEEASSLHNPYAGVPSAWQLTETVDDFLRRLPPATTDQTTNCPWIYICNPYIQRVQKNRAENQLSSGNEDEAPEEEGAKLSHVSQGGMERLQLLTGFIKKIEATGERRSVIEKAVNEEKNRAALDILHLAHVGKVRAGKWMLFASVADVNETWETVAKATAKNELGIAAKVAPRSLAQDPRRERLICIYTRDFADKADVKRVLAKLRALRLVDGRRRPIYYKPDAFTYIGIASGNPWGIKASIYSSNDAFLALPGMPANSSSRGSRP